MAACRAADPPQRHVATVAHRLPGEARVTCTCHGLRTSVDVDDREALSFALWDHLRNTPVDHLLVDDTRTGILYALDERAEPETRLILTGSRP